MSTVMEITITETFAPIKSLRKSWAQNPFPICLLVVNLIAEF